MQIYSLLNKIGLNNLEIDTMININKELAKIDPEQVYTNLVMVSDAGFPDDDLRWLAYNNPTFLTLTTEELQQKIEEVNKNHKDFEDALKQNPNLI